MVDARSHAKRGVSLTLTVLFVAVCVGVGIMLGMRVWGHLLPWGVTPEVSAAEQPATTTGELPARQVSYTPWDASESPQYFRVVGKAVVDVDIPAGQIWYAPLDALGRTVRAAGTIDAPTMEAGLARERGNLMGHDPSGWGHNAETDIALPDGGTYHGHLWNRSHLVAKSLGGSDEVENLVCATRMENVGANDGEGGMAYGEDLVRTWLRGHRDGSVFYSATPAYEGNELVCRSVVVDIRSSDGSLDLEIEVYNAALGHRIDYVTGEWRLETPGA